MFTFFKLLLFSLLYVLICLQVETLNIALSITKFAFTIQIFGILTLVVVLETDADVYKITRKDLGVYYIIYEKNET